MKRSFLLSYFLLFSVVIGMAQVKVKAELDSASILIGQRAYLKISVEASEGDKVTFPDYKIQQEITPGVEVLNTCKDTISTSGARQLVATYVLTGWDQQDYKIPSLQVIVNGQKSFTKTFILQVKEEKISKRQSVQKPADDIIMVPFALSDLISPACWLLVAIVLLVAAALLRKRIKQNKGITMLQKSAKKLTPYEEAIDAVRKLQTEVHQNIDQKIYYTNIADVLRRYIKKSFNINALESTSDEILHQLRDKISNVQLQELKRLFITADLVKFAKYSTTENDKEYYLSNMLHFVEDTKSINEYQEEVLPKEPAAIQGGDFNNRMMKLVVVALVIVALIVLAYVIYDVYRTVM